MITNKIHDSFFWLFIRYLKFLCFEKALIQKFHMKKLLEIEDKLNKALFVNERIKCKK